MKDNRLIRGQYLGVMSSWGFLMENLANYRPKLAHKGCRGKKKKYEISETESAAFHSSQYVGESPRVYLWKRMSDYFVVKTRH